LFATVTDRVAVAVDPFWVTVSVIVWGPSLNFRVSHETHIAVPSSEFEASVVPSTRTVICLFWVDDAVVLTAMLRLPFTVAPLTGDEIVAEKGAFVVGSGLDVVFETVTDRVAVPIPPAESVAVAVSTRVPFALLVVFQLNVGFVPVYTLAPSTASL